MSFSSPAVAVKIQTRKFFLVIAQVLLAGKHTLIIFIQHMKVIKSTDAIFWRNPRLFMNSGGSAEILFAVVITRIGLVVSCIQVSKCPNIPTDWLNPVLICMSLRSYWGIVILK
jgi:hypothetical protein